MRMMFHQIKNINNKIGIIKKKNQIEILIKKYKNWNKKYSRGAQQEIWESRRKHGQRRRQAAEGLVWGTHREKDEWKGAEPQKSEGTTGTSGHTHQLQERKEETERIFEEAMAKNLQIWRKALQTHPRSSTNSRRLKSKRSTLDTSHRTAAEQRGTLVVTPPVPGNLGKRNGWACIRNHWGQGQWGDIFKVLTTNQELCVQSSHPSRMR